ncbi:hypothetical protein [Chamaesiphon sp. VAR_48_metabat_403]|nr:hypothetical protein [Chamaesiphon sp. VAR_48_metabat_403]
MKIRSIVRTNWGTSNYRRTSSKPERIAKGRNSARSCINRDG